MPQIQVIKPVDGELLNRSNGVEGKDALQIRLAPDEPPVELRALLNRITVDGREITVLWDRSSFPRYSFFIDDNMYWLEEIHSSAPKSVFEHFYLSRLRQMHRKYGAKFLLNLFYHNHDHSFTLAMFSDRWKAEFEGNSDWLRLSFHAAGAQPHHPYGACDTAVLMADYDKLCCEVERFAGGASFQPPQILHWYDTTEAGRKFLVSKGVRCLGEWGAVFDNMSIESGHAVIAFRESAEVPILRMPVEFFCNCLTPDKIQERLNGLTKDYINIGTHEQYFYHYYDGYIADHFDRVDAVLSHLTKSGYKSVWAGTGIFGNTRWEQAQEKP